MNYFNSKIIYFSKLVIIKESSFFFKKKKTRLSDIFLFCIKRMISAVLKKTNLKKPFEVPNSNRFTESYYFPHKHQTNLYTYVINQ